ncbi:TonB-dependent receptor [Kordiimonas gwangyangensis]|uniref:TonB-dependent receptor n=1 Tax=Kordiimonas gwangyangensis TaxID=288022 RepID=UPI00036C65CB|nr:TonB-dependent receptor [Kordiimonas gwangyangensis]
MASAKKYRIPVTTASLCALLATPIGYAQAEENAAETTESFVLEEIIVSARKRAESIQDVPLSISALGADQIDRVGVTDVTGLAGRVPGLYFNFGGGVSPTSGFQYISLRGVGFNGGLEPSTGVFIDGMYQPQIGFDLAFLDIAQIEVLRGPQGTLFGRNTQAGAINIVTKKPDEEFAGKLLLQYGGFNELRARGAIRGPLAETLFAGLSVEYYQTDGYLDNGVTGADYNTTEQIAGRGVLRYVPSSDFEVTIVGDVSKKDYNEIGRGVPFGSGDYTVIADNDDLDHKTNSGIQATIDWSLNDTLNLTSITGYRVTDADTTVDLNGRLDDQTPVVLDPAQAPVDFLTNGPVSVAGTSQSLLLNQTFFSEEVRLSGEHDSLDWLVGLYYFDQTQDQERALDIGLAPAGTNNVPPLYVRENFVDARDGWAAFGQASYMVATDLELTFGARYSKENIDVVKERILAVLSGGNTVLIPTYQPDDSDSFDNVSIMASISYDWSDDLQTYFTYAEGWKAGGFNRFPSRQNAVASYDDELSENWELGIKGQAFDGALTFNLAAFWISIDGQQLLNIVPDPAGLTPITIIENAGSSRSRGFEWELTARPLDGLTLDFNGTYADTEMLEFLQCNSLGDINDPNDDVCFDFAGSDFENTPELVMNSSLTYTMPLGGDDWSIEFFVNYRYVDGFNGTNNSFNGRLGEQIPVESYDRLDAKISVFDDDGWRATLFVDNLLDSYDVSYVSFDPTSVAYDKYVHPLEPRQIGIVLSKTF